MELLCQKTGLRQLFEILCPLQQAQHDPAVACIVAHNGYAYLKDMRLISIVSLAGVWSYVCAFTSLDVDGSEMISNHQITLSQSFDVRTSVERTVTPCKGCKLEKGGMLYPLGASCLLEHIRCCNLVSV